MVEQVKTFNITVKIPDTQLQQKKKESKQLCVLLYSTGTVQSKSDEVRPLTWIVVPVADLQPVNNLLCIEHYYAHTIESFDMITKDEKPKNHINSSPIELHFNNKYKNTLADPYTLKEGAGSQETRVIGFENNAEQAICVVLTQKYQFNSHKEDSPFVAFPLKEKSATGPSRVFIKPPCNLMFTWVNDSVQSGTFKERLDEDEEGFFIENANLGKPLEVTYNSEASWELIKPVSGVKTFIMSAGMVITSQILKEGSNVSYLVAETQAEMIRVTATKMTTEEEDEEKRKKIDQAHF